MYSPLSETGSLARPVFYVCGDIFAVSRSQTLVLGTRGRRFKSSHPDSFEKEESTDGFVYDEYHCT